MRWSLLLSVVLACARPGAGPGDDTTPPRSTPRLQVRALSLEHVALPSDGFVHLALWIDGGTLDASPPASATLAAWSIEADGLNARATPDGLELSLRGPADELDGLLDRLAAALATRRLSEARHVELAARLVEARRRATASPARRADELALRQVLGDAVSPFEGEPNQRDVERFFAAAFGPERALLVAIGDVPTAELRAAVARAFEHAPAAEGLPRRALAPAPAMEPERGPSTAATVAVSSPSLDEAWGLARALAPETRSVLVFPHPGGATTLQRAEPAALPLLATQARLARVAPRAPPDPADLAALSERRGTRWLSERHGLRLDRRVSVGALCRDEGGEPCLAAVASARAIPEVETEERSARAPNGAVVQVEPREGALVLALRFATGGEAPATAGVSASALARRCSVEAALEQVTAEVDPQGLTVLARAAAAELHEEALAALTRCALVSSVREHERLRVRALEERRREPERGWLARALTPGATAVVAPRGDARALSRAFDAGAALRALRVGARTRLAVVGPVPPRATATLGARLLASLPAGSPVEAMTWGEPAPLVAERFEAARVRIALGWRTDVGGVGAAVVARAFADSVELGEEAEVRWRDGGEGPGGAWAAVAVDVAPEHVDAVVARARATHGPSAAELSRAIERERWAGADARVAALRLVRRGETRAALPEDPGAVARGLREGAFVVAIGRSQRAGAWNRR